MLYTLADARELVTRFVDSGTCDLTIVDRQINQALERLTDGEDWACMRKQLRVAVCNNCFTLPRNVEKIVHVAVDGTPAKLFGTSYQFLSSGQGDLAGRGGACGFKDLVDEGDNWPMFFDIPGQYEIAGEAHVPQGMKLVAFSKAQADTDKVLRIRGCDSQGHEIGAGVNPGEDVPIHHWAQGVEGSLRGTWDVSYPLSTARFAEVAHILKPETQDYVTLFAVDPAQNYFFFLGKYHPIETRPQYRRYRITNKQLATGAHVLAEVKMRHVPLTHADDLLPIDSLQALKLMVMALSLEDAHTIEGAALYEAMAGRVLGNREKARVASGGMPVIVDHEYRTSLGRHVNRGILI